MRKKNRYTLTKLYLIEFHLDAWFTCSKKVLGSHTSKRLCASNINKTSYRAVNNQQIDILICHCRRKEDSLVDLVHINLHAKICCDQIVYTPSSYFRIFLKHIWNQIIYRLFQEKYGANLSKSLPIYYQTFKGWLTINCSHLKEWYLLTIEDCVKLLHVKRYTKTQKKSWKR